MHYEEEVECVPPPKSPIPAALLTSLITTVVVFFALQALDARSLLPKFGAKASMVDVPSLAGMRPEQAREVLKARELWLAISAERDDPQVPVGSIAAQTPQPGTLLPHGSTVTAVVSRGTHQAVVPSVVGLAADKAPSQITAPAEKPMPKVIGLRMAKAQALLEEQGFKVGKVRHIVDGEQDSGAVLEQKPAPGTRAAPETAVDLVVNGD